MMIIFSRYDDIDTGDILSELDLVSHVNNMAVTSRNLAWVINIFMAYALTNVICENLETYVPLLKDFPPPLLQKHIQISRHLPVCVIFRHKGVGYRLESKLVEIWENRDRALNYSSWQIGSFPANSDTISPIRLPSEIPTLRCYLGSSSAVDYTGKPNKKGLQKWFSNLAEKYNEQIQEASFQSIEQATSRTGLSLVAFSGFDQHYVVEDMLLQIKERWRNLSILFVHPFSPDVRKLQDLYKVSGHPFLIFIENSDSTSGKPEVVKELKSVEVSLASVDNFLLMKSMPVTHLNKDNFADTLMKKTKFYTPTLVLFVLKSLSPKTTDYLRAYARTIEEFTDFKVHLKYALFEIHIDSRKILEEHVQPVYTTAPPFTILFQAKWKKTTVVGVEQVLIRERPTPWTVASALSQQEIDLTTKEGQSVHYRPWGRSDPTQMSELFEGPHGTMCSWHASNNTNNDPPLPPPVKPRAHRVVTNTPIPQKDDPPTPNDTHDKFGSETIEKMLGTIGSIPLLTGDTWQQVVEKSHAPLHPFNVGGKWSGEVTKVTLVVFIMADCGSCHRNMDLFQRLHTAVSYVDGGALYLMNCTSNPDTCREHHVTGFPTLSVFRGLGWMDGSDCFTPHSAMTSKHVRMDYHGVLTEKTVMAWFSKAASSAVSNVKFERLHPDDMEESVRLVGTILPKHSQYLPRMPAKNVDYFYPYRCFRLACERLYSQASCYVQFSTKIPQSQYNVDEQADMVLTQVELQRNDGLHATVAELGRSLMNTLQDEADNSVHSFHKPHRYSLRPSQKCEDDHGFCTDLIVNFTHDHGRLPVTHMSSETFHTRNNIIFYENLPVMVALVYEDNITESSKFLKTLRRTAEELYNDMIVVTVDVMQYPAWAGQFIPRNRRMELLEEEALDMFYIYPRLCLLRWQDHRHAAFYPPPDVAIAEGANFRFVKKEIVEFARYFLANPYKMMIETEHF